MVRAHKWNTAVWTVRGPLARLSTLTLFVGIVHMTGPTAVAAPANMRIARYVIQDYTQTGGTGCITGDATFPGAIIRGQQFASVGVTTCPGAQDYTSASDASSTYGVLTTV